MPDNYHIGDFDTLVTILERGISTGDQGNKTYTWKPRSRVWAKVVRNLTEMVDNGNLEDGKSLEIHIYKIPGLDTRWRVLVDNVPYEIRNVNMVSRISPVCILSLFSIGG
jgi:hypothetical protein